MNQPIDKLRILMLEDVTTDAELAEQMLQNGGLDFTALRVDTRAAFERALDEFKPDIVLADYNLPAYNGHAALEYARLTHPQIPVIMVTGALGDEAAVELLKMGARDYVLKGNLVRLLPAIKRALSEERDIRNRRIAEEKYQILFSEARDGIVLVECGSGSLMDCNQEFQRQSGRTLSQLQAMKIWELFPQEKQDAARRQFLETRELGGGESELQRPDGKIVQVDSTSKIISIHGLCFIQIISRDITERHIAERLRQESELRYRRLFESAKDGILILDAQTGLIMDANPFILDLLSYSYSEITGKKLWEIGLFEDAAARETVLHELQSKGFIRYEDLLLETKDGRRINVEFVSNAFDVGERKVIQCNIRDISERKHAEEALRRLNRSLRTLSAADAALIKAHDVPQLLDAACEVIVQQGGYAMAWVGYAEEDEAKSIVPMACRGVEKSELINLQLTWADVANGQSALARSIRSGQIQISSDVRNDPSFESYRALTEAHDLNANLTVPLSGGKRVFGGLSIFSSDTDAFNADEVAMLNELGGDLAYGIVALMTRAERDQAAEKNRQYLALIQANLTDTIRAIVATVEMRDPYTAGHEKRVAELAVAIGGEMGLARERLDGLNVAGNVHDVGKIRIPAEILSKPRALTELELALVRLHPETGYQILKGIDFPWPVANIVLQHHERLDGSGYPRGLKGNEILLEAQILSVADAVESILSHRPYRPALGVDAAFDEIRGKRGKLYNADAIDACIKLFKEKAFTFS